MINLTRCVAASVLLICFALAFAQMQDIPPEVLSKYRKQVSETEEKMQQETPRYQSPGLQTVDTVSVPKRKKDDDEKKPKKRTFGTFKDHIIIDDDTVQVIEKALPKELDRFGIDLFSAKQYNGAVLSGLFSDDYILGPGDKIIVNVWGDGNYQYDLEIDAQGKVFIPIAGEMHLEGMTFRRAKDEIKTFLSDIYSNVNISITPGKIKSINVYVVGDVNYPGSYSMSGLANVLNAIDYGGGPARTGSYRQIQVIRNDKIYSEVDLYQIITEGKAAGNINLGANDIVFVPSNKGIVKLRGAVLRPAEYEIKEGTTFEDLIHLAGGLLPNADRYSISVDRIEGQNHNILTIDFSDSLDRQQKVLPMDDVSVFTISPYRDKAIFVEGHTVHAGAYKYFEDMTIIDFITENDVLLQDTYLDRVSILRKTEDLQRKIISVNLKFALKGDKTHDIPLEDGDILRFLNKNDFLSGESVFISGMVRKEGKYEYYKDMMVSDLILFADGLRNDSYRIQGEVSRVSGVKKAKRITFDVNEAFNNPGSSSDLLLRPDDHVFIRRDPDSKTQRLVSITGEVKFPGSYALFKEDEDIASIIERSGGFTEQAFIQGTVFKRERISEDIEDRDLQDILQKTMPTLMDSSGTFIQEKRDFTSLDRIIINLEKALEGDRKENIILKDGDDIYIPPKQSGVSIKGAVAFEGTIKYIEGKKARYYVNRAGGFLKNADSGEVRLVKYNGMVLKIGLGYPKIDPGDLIVVPTEEEKDKDIMQILMDTVTIISGLATTIYILIKL
ncbi:MAG: SLBB domain-containing protein [Candidatus Zixiibacteriota bacterium]